LPEVVEGMKFTSGVEMADAAETSAA